jgi:hypothetical protein
LISVRSTTAAIRNMGKLEGRTERGTLAGDGDYR